MKYSIWKLTLQPISKLKLDTENPRLGTGIQRMTQEELIAELLRHSRVYELARDIARQGFMPTETLVAVKKGINLVVIEGNRRLAALKLLANPSLAPDDYRKRIETLASEMKVGLPKKIPVTIATNRQDTIPLVVEKHNGQTIEGWTRVMQSRYITNLLDHDISVDDAVDVYGLDRALVLRALWESRLYDVIRSLDLPEVATAAVRDPRSFPFTTLTRLFETPVVQQWIGAQINDKHGFVVVGDHDQFKERLATIVKDIVDETVTSRSHNTIDQITTYLESKFKERTKKSKAPDGVPAKDFIDPAKLEPNEPKKPRKRRHAPRPSVSIVPRGFVCNVGDARIEDVFEELRGLRVSEFPNAVAITFRSLLDMAVTKHMSDSGELRAYLQADKLKNPNRRSDWIPSLAQQLSYLNGLSSWPIGPEGRKSITKFLTDTKTSLTLETLNWFAHVRYVPPTEEQLRAFWVLLTPLLELTLQK